METAGEMGEAVRTNLDRADILIMAAAVSDYRFPEISPRKIKKSETSRSVELVRTEDILESLPEKRGAQIVIGFAAETEDVMKNAFEKLKRKNLDLIVANDVSSQDSGFESDFNRISLIYPGGREVEVELGTKRDISRTILDAIEGIIEEKD